MTDFNKFILRMFGNSSRQQIKIRLERRCIVYGKAQKIQEKQRKAKVLQRW